MRFRTSRWAVLLAFAGCEPGTAELLVQRPALDAARVRQQSAELVPGPAGDTAFGRRAVGVGDVNGDGFADVAVSSVRDGQGRVTVLLGAATGLSVQRSAPVQPSGQLAFGTSIAGLGDVDGDGYDELAVGDPTGVNPDVGGATGVVWVFRGGPDGPDQAPWQQLAGATDPGARFGESLSVVADLRGQGARALLIGAPGQATGAAYVYDDSAINGVVSPVALANPGGASPASSADGFAATVAGIGDFNGDGFGDFAIGAPTAARVHVYFGAAAFDASTTAVLLVGTPGSSFGIAISGGYLDDDPSASVRLADLVVGSSTDDAARGRVDVFDGGLDGLDAGRSQHRIGIGVSSFFGQGLAVTADQNGDGYDDLVVGSPGSAISGVSVYYGGPLGLAADPVGDLLTTSGAAEGYTTAAAGDVDGDGLADVSYGNLAAGVGYFRLLRGEQDQDRDGFFTTDCDDADPAAFPGALEVCDGADNNCDGQTDDDDPLLDRATGLVWYRDGDGDGFGDATQTVRACAEPTGYVADSSDCNDQSAAINPDAAEVCDGVDNDCDGLFDDADPDVDETTKTDWYADEDGDNYGDVAVMTRACVPPLGQVPNALDCDDGEAEVYPGQSEVCDGIDNDCDGLVDDADTDVDLVTGGTWYVDQDGDGTGTSAVSACVQPPNTVDVAGDCDDDNEARSPSFVEQCGSGVDEDCDGAVDWDDEDCDVTAALPPRWGCAAVPGGAPWLGAWALGLALARRRRGAARRA